MSDTKKIPAQTEDENTGAQTPAQSIEALRQKYGGEIYAVGITVPVDDLNRKEFSYRFKRPATQSYDRYVSTAAKVGITKASKTFMLDSVIDEDKDRLMADLDENPGMAISIGNKLTEILGLSDTVNLTKL